MRTSRKIAATALAGTLLATAFGVAGATAQTTQDTVVTLEVEGGTLSITQASNAANIGKSTFSVLGTKVAGPLSQTTVTDNQNVVGTWAVNVSMAANFTRTGGTEEIDKSNAVAYIPGTVVATDPDPLLGGTMTGSTTALAPESGVSLAGTGGTLVSGATALGGGTVTYTPSMQVTVPNGTVNGIYTGTMTQTVSAG